MKIPSQPEALRLGSVLAAVGAATIVVGIVLDSARMWANLLLAGVLIGGVGIASVFFVAAEDVAGGRWSRSLREVPAALSRGLLVTAGALLLVVLVHPTLYPWASHSPPGVYAAWFSYPFFLTRTLIYLAVWIGSAWLLLPERGMRPGPVRGAAAFLVVFAVTVWLAGNDWLMSLTPNWTSTIYGVFVVASFFAAAAASVTLVASVLKGCVLADKVSDDQLHDLGVLVFGLTSFWMYIWFCQFMLIWYTTVPEEARYFVTRLTNGWAVWFFVAPLLVWVLPFTLLLSSGARRNGSRLAAVSATVVLGSWVNLYVMIVPTVAPTQSMPGLWELGLLLGTLGVFVVLTSLGLERVPLDGASAAA